VLKTLARSLSELVSVQERGYYSAFLLAAWGLGGAVGPLIAGALGQHWRAMIWATLVIVRCARP
jgi:MFS family permease